MSLTDDFTRAAWAKVKQRTRPPGISGQTAPSMEQEAERDGYRRGFMDAVEWARDYLTAQKPDVQHLWRPGASPSAFCGDEAAKPWVSVTREESLAVPVCALCHRRAMHESHDLWAARQDPSGPLRPLTTDERSYRYAQDLGYELPEEPR